MRASRYILALILLLLGEWVHATPADSTSAHRRSFAERRQQIEQMLDENLGFSKEMHFNDVLHDADALATYYTKHEDYLHLFQLKELIIYIHATKGDVIRASELCRKLRAMAEKMGYVPGIILANHAEGLIFLNTNMLHEGQEKFAEAYRLLDKIPQNDCLQELVLLQLVPIVLHLNLMDEADRLLDDLQQLGQRSGRPLSRLIYECFRTYYYNVLGDYQPAKECLQRAEAIYKQHPYPYYENYLLFAQLGYARATHDHQASNRYYTLLADMNRREEIARNSVEYNQLLSEYYVHTGNYRAACQIYNQLHAASDSVQKHNYQKQIDLLRTFYEIDHEEMASRRQRNRLLMACLIGSLLILGCTAIYILIYRQLNRHLKRSRAALEVARQHAERSIRAKSLFLSNMSHEIRTPLNALAGFSSILVEEGVDEEMRRQCSEIISQNSDLLQKLIADIVDLSNIELGQMKFNFGYYDAVSICQNVTDTVEQIKQTSADILFESELESCPVQTDKARLQQVLINLLVNATKFTREGHITLTLAKQDEENLLFTVADTGCGIPADRRQQIFKRFEKLHEEAQGSGLGLSICQVIIERIGGKIWIDPDYDQGACFHFTHPLHPEGGRKEVAV